MVDFSVKISDEQWEKANNKEKIILASIRQRNKWWSNFELSRNEKRDYIFSMIMESQCFNGYVKVFFISQTGRFCFQFKPEMTEVRDIENDEIIQDINPIETVPLTACQLVFYYQVCEILDGLLSEYYIM
ncbi:MAG: hypothetical protein K5765_06580 [Clostridia bacterium]|nr:hypothetical protein [Clostridia bacterium]